MPLLFDLSVCPPHVLFLQAAAVLWYNGPALFPLPLARSLRDARGTEVGSIIIIIAVVVVILWLREVVRSRDLRRGGAYRPS